jgi:hypothetical protein
MLNAQFGYQSLMNRQLRPCEHFAGALIKEMMQ